MELHFIMYALFFPSPNASNFLSTTIMYVFCAILMSGHLFHRKNLRRNKSNANILKFEIENESQSSDYFKTKWHFAAVFWFAYVIFLPV